MVKEPMDTGNTLVEIFTEISHGNQGIVFIEGVKGDRFVSYRDLYQSALTVLFNLQCKGMQPGNELLFQVADNFDFIPIFWGCLLGKIIPVPVTMAKNDNYRFKLLKIWEVLRNPYLIASQNVVEGLESFAQKNQLEDIYTRLVDRKLSIDDLRLQSGVGDIVNSNQNDIAFIQFSSGSTSDPKGVTLTHKNLLTNLNDLAQAIKAPLIGDKVLNWMPLTHDMGLIGLHLLPTINGWSQFIMSPELFVRHPLIWLEKISQYQATIIGSPNFGYRHVLKFYHSDKCQTIDLSSVRVLFNGAEPISADLCHKFIKSMEPLGLKSNAMFPSYGLAEATVAVSFPQVGQELIEVSVDRNCLNPGMKIKEIPIESRHAVTFIEIGKSIKHCRLRITDESDVEVEDRIVGHIQIQGENVTSGYYNNPEATQKAITADGWLRTGDLGFLRAGRLVIMGRSKDVLFVNGANFYAHDLEFVCDWLEGVDSREIAVCGVYNPDLQMDQVLCFVVFRGHLEEFPPLLERIKKHIVQQTGIGISQIIPVKSIPVTTSGKKQRYRLKEAYQRGEYDAIIQRLLELQRELAG